MSTAPQFNGISASILRPRLACIGYLKIGGKRAVQTSRTGKEIQPPEKYDHFRVRSRARDTSGNYVLDEVVHKAVGPKPTELDVRFLWDEPAQNFKTSLNAFQEGKLRCEGDGERAFDRVLNKQIPCTCPLLKQHKGDYPTATFPRPIGAVSCKPYGVLSVFLERAAVYGGYHVFRTTSWETISSLSAALDLFKTQFGMLSWIPFKLLLYPHTVTYEEGGKSKTSKAYAVSLVLRGSMETAYQIAATARERRASALQLTSGAYTPEQHEEQVAEVEREDQPEVAGEFHPAPAGPAEPDYETIEEDEGPHPLEPRIRLALELAQVPPDRVNKAIAEYSDRIAELAILTEEKRPDQWRQAGEQLAAAEAEPEPVTTGGPPLDLFGDL